MKLLNTRLALVSITAMHFVTAEVLTAHLSNHGEIKIDDNSMDGSEKTNWLEIRGWNENIKWDQEKEKKKNYNWEGGENKDNEDCEEYDEEDEEEDCEEYDEEDCEDKEDDEDCDNEDDDEEDCEDEEDIEDDDEEDCDDEEGGGKNWTDNVDGSNDGKSSSKRITVATGPTGSFNAWPVPTSGQPTSTYIPPIAVTTVTSVYTQTFTVSNGYPIAHESEKANSTSDSFSR